MADFKLSAQLVGHESDVRDLVFPSPDLVLSASRDHTVRAWRRSSTNPPSFEPTIANQIHEYVNSVTFVPISSEYPEGLVVSGGKDPCLDVRKPSATLSDNAERLLPGHANNVCSLAAAPNGEYVVSGSWDHTARVWSTKKWESELTLSGHEGAVWDVLALNETTVVTGCADKNIRLYDLRQATAGQASPRSTIVTPDVVRGLCQVPSGHPSGADIASSHNDGIIRLWKLSGQQVGELRGHDSFVYRLATLPTGEIVSAAEDRTVRVWSGFDCVQTITHPAISVWTVAACPESGDIVTGTSDGIARVFTRSADRVASAEVAQMFEEAVKTSSIPQQQMGDINKEKLPGPDFLQSKSGTKEGQVQMIREANGSITAHTWSMGAQSWVNVGTVVDSASSTGKKVDYQGKMYDFVFDVAIEEGQPSLKLPYNLSDNPYETATKFINDNELSLNYLDQVAQFITQNTQGATIGESGGGGGGPDPYGTESRYRPGEGAPSTIGKYLPQKEYLDITSAKYEPIFKKILSINSNLVAAGRKDYSLNPSAQTSLDTLRQALESRKPVTNEEAVELLVMMCTQWDYADRLAPLDLLRCTATSPVVATYSKPGLGSVIEIAGAAALDGVPTGSQPNENCAMMAFRTVANLFSTSEGRKLLAAEAPRVTDLMERVLGIKGGQAIGPHNRNMLLALSTMAMNYAVMASKQGGSVPKDVQRRFIAGLSQILREQADGEVLFRAAVAAGTFLTVVGKEEAQGLSNAVAMAKDRSSDPRVKDAAAECIIMLQ
ncbi:Polyubiquitin binding protein (Doa1 ufd3) [Apiospora saccharicola]